MNPRTASCGTESGYARHLRLREKACQACLDANRRARRRRAAQPSAEIRRIAPGVGERACFPTLPRAEWMEQAACRSVDPEWFFSEDRNEQARALEACRGCPVLAECLDYAVRSGSEGIWAGLMPSQLDYYRKWRSA